MSQIQPDSVLSRDNSLLATDLDGELVMMHIENGRYYSLAKTARRIWDAMATPVRFDALCAQLAETYDQPIERITQDVEPFIEEMLSEKLIQLK